MNDSITPTHDQTEDAQPICPHCVEEVSELDDICPHCGGPITANAMIDPMKQIYAWGYLTRRLFGERPKLITVIGVWLFVVPQMLIGLLFLVMGTYSVMQGNVSFSPDGSTHGQGGGFFAIIQLIGFLAYVAMLIWFGVVLWRVTMRYCLPASVDDVNE